MKLQVDTDPDAVDFVRGMGIEADGFDAMEEGHIPGLYIVFAIYERAPLRSFVVHPGKGLIAETRDHGFVFAEPAGAIHALN